MAEMMEEFDFEAEEVLLIHPDEDIRKIEAIETDTNSYLEQASDFDIGQIETIEPDAKSSLEQATDSDIKRTEAVEYETNSNLKQAMDSGIKRTEAVETDATLDLKEASNSDIRKVKAFEIDSSSIPVQTLDSDSDSGEIDDDEEINDLEEGEIKDSCPVSKKKSDIACRFFKRGSCAYGSQCQYLHVSDTVYKMFDTNSQKRNNVPLVELHSFPKPPIFPPVVLPPRPFLEPPIPIVEKANYHRECETFEDTWEKGLEQARLLIRKANSKKKNEESEQKRFDSNNKDEKNKGPYFPKAGFGNELDFNNKKYCEKNSSYNSFRKENVNDEKKSGYRYQPNSSDKWVDPWRRSKSPLTRKRLRSLSGSPPSRSRKHSSPSSTSSISSSSSEFDDIYRRPYVKKSPRSQQTFKSRSRSISQSRKSKKRKLSPKHSFNGRNRRSNSRSLSVSSYRRRTSSCVRSRSSSSCSDCHVSPVAQDKEMKRISAKLDQQISRQSPKRASESLDSDCETSEMTVSSASCTSLSSDSETESPSHRSLKGKMSARRNDSSSYSNETNLSNAKVFNRNRSNFLKNQDLMQQKNDSVPAYQRRIQPSDNRKNLNNWSFNTSAERKPKNSASYFSSIKKPASASRSLEKKMPDDMELLSAYQRKSQTSDNSKNLNSWDFKTAPTDCNFKSTSYSYSVTKPTSASKGPGNKISSEMELSAYQGKTQPSDSRNNVKSESVDCKPKNTASCSSSVKKSASAPKNSGSKLTGDMELLFMYQDLANTNRNNSNVQKAKSNNPISKPNRTKDAVDITNKGSSNSKSHNSESDVGNVTKKNIVLNLQTKCKDYFKPELFNKSRDLDDVAVIKKETASKREQLLTKLKLIDDAIARKKSK